jgi:hypothetical protein
MSSILRSKDVAVRKSPSVSATAYPKGYTMTGNDGNEWEIIVDSRGTHRWQKKTATVTFSHPVGLPSRNTRSQVINVKKVEEEETEFEKNVRKSLEGYKILIAEEPSLITEIESKVRKRKEGLEMLADEGDDDAARGAKILRIFLKETFNHGGKISKLEDKEKMYENVLRMIPRKSERVFILNSLSKIDKKKLKFN